MSNDTTSEPAFTYCSMVTLCFHSDLIWMFIIICVELFDVNVPSVESPLGLMLHWWTRWFRLFRLLLLRFAHVSHCCSFMFAMWMLTSWNLPMHWGVHFANVGRTSFSDSCYVCLYTPERTWKGPNCIVILCRRRHRPYTFTCGAVVVVVIVTGPFDSDREIHIHKSVT